MDVRVKFLYHENHFFQKKKKKDLNQKTSMKISCHHLIKYSRINQFKLIEYVKIQNSKSYNENFQEYKQKKIKDFK